MHQQLEQRKADLTAGANDLRGRITQLETALQQHKNSLEATLGAIQECEYWLKQPEVVQDVAK